MCDMLMENTTLREVNLSGNEFNDTDAIFFAEALKSNFKLKANKWNVKTWLSAIFHHSPFSPNVTISFSHSPRWFDSKGPVQILCI